MNNSFYATKKMGEARRNKGWTQKQLAEVITLKTGVDVSLSLVQKWEIGNRAISDTMTVIVANLLDINVSDFVEGR